MGVPSVPESEQSVLMRFAVRHPVARILFLFAFLSLLASCATRPAGTQAPLELFWPPPPGPARIQWVGEIYGPQDVGITKGFWGKLIQRLVGEGDDEIRKPYGIYADRSDRLFVADSAAAVVHLFDRREKRYLAIGTGKDRVFRTPIGLTGDGDDTLFIADAAAAIVFRYRIGKKVLEPFLSGKVTRPTGIAYDPVRRLLYVTDTAAHQVIAFDLDGGERFRFGHRGVEPGAFNYPTDLFLDAGGNLHVTDPLNARIQSFSADGKFLGTFGLAGDTAGRFAKPKGVALDSEAHVYVADTLQDSVQIFDRSGRYLLSFGARGTRSGEFWMPSGIFIDSNDIIYVADTYNRRLQVFRYLNAPAASAGDSGSAKGKQ